MAHDTQEKDPLLAGLDPIVVKRIETTESDLPTPGPDRDPSIIPPETRHKLAILGLPGLNPALLPRDDSLRTPIEAAPKSPVERAREMTNEFLGWLSGPDSDIPSPSKHFYLGEGHHDHDKVLKALLSDFGLSADDLKPMVEAYAEGTTFAIDLDIDNLVPTSAEQSPDGLSAYRRKWAERLLKKTNPKLCLKPSYKPGSTKESRTLLTLDVWVAKEPKTPHPESTTG